MSPLTKVGTWGGRDVESDGQNGTQFDPCTSRFRIKWDRVRFVGLNIYKPRVVKLQYYLILFLKKIAQKARKVW
jgi:hypothetical protein